MAHFLNLDEYDILEGKTGKNRTINTHNIVELEDIGAINRVTVTRIFLADGRQFAVAKDIRSLLNDFQSLGIRY